VPQARFADACARWREGDGGQRADILVEILGAQLQASQSEAADHHVDQQQQDGPPTGDVNPMARLGVAASDTVRAFPAQSDGDPLEAR
jgi:hypothetical protein